MSARKFAVAALLVALSGAAAAEPAKTPETAASGETRPAATATTAAAPAATAIPIAATQASAHSAVTGKRGRIARVTPCRCGGQAPAAN